MTATSTTPTGPYTWDRETVTIGPHHAGQRRGQGIGSSKLSQRYDTVAVQNPVVVRLQGGAGFVIFYAGSNLTTPHYGMNNSAIMAAHSKSLDGPWRVQAEPVLKPFTSPESWSVALHCNPSTYMCVYTRAEALHVPRELVRGAPLQPFYIIIRVCICILRSI